MKQLTEQEISQLRDRFLLDSRLGSRTGAPNFRALVRTIERVLEMKLRADAQQETPPAEDGGPE